MRSMTTSVEDLSSYPCTRQQRLTNPSPSGGRALRVAAKWSQRVFLPTNVPLVAVQK
jgi:hypothetical protein